MINYRLFFLFTLLSLCFSATAQTAQEIRIDYQRIQEELPQYTTKTISVDEMSAEGGELTGYYNDSILQKIAAVFFGERGKQLMDFYYKDTIPIFIVSTRHSYNRPMYYTKEMAEEYDDDEYFSPEKTTITEESFYVQKDSIIIWLNNDGNPAELEEEEKKMKTQVLISTSQRLQKRLAALKEEDE